MKKVESAAIEHALDLRHDWSHATIVDAGNSSKGERG